MSGRLLAALHYTVLNSPHQRKGSYKIRDMNIGTVKYTITNILTEGRDVTRSGREISPCVRTVEEARRNMFREGGGGWGVKTVYRRNESQTRERVWDNRGDSREG